MPPLIPQLSDDLMRRIWSFDSTFRDKYDRVVEEMKLNRDLAAIFTLHLQEVIFSPSYRFAILQKYRKEELLNFLHFIGPRRMPPRRCTKRRLLAIICCIHLQLQQDGAIPNFFDSGGMWLFL